MGIQQEKLNASRTQTNLKMYRIDQLCGLAIDDCRLAFGILEEAMAADATIDQYVMIDNQQPNRKDSRPLTNLKIDRIDQQCGLAINDREEGFDRKSTAKTESFKTSY